MCDHFLSVMCQKDMDWKPSELNLVRLIIFSILEYVEVQMLHLAEKKYSMVIDGSECTFILCGSEGTNFQKYSIVLYQRSM